MSAGSIGPTEVQQTLGRTAKMPARLTSFGPRRSGTRPPHSCRADRSRARIAERFIQVGESSSSPPAMGPRTPGQESVRAPRPPLACLAGRGVQNFEVVGNAAVASSRPDMARVGPPSRRADRPFDLTSPAANDGIHLANADGAFYPSGPSSAIPAPVPITWAEFRLAREGRTLCRCRSIAAKQYL